jgi:hypothetical protein
VVAYILLSQAVKFRAIAKRHMFSRKQRQGCSGQQHGAEVSEMAAQEHRWSQALW